jgi:hypothetical protein
VVTGFIGPSDSGDTYAATDSVYNRGGFKSVDNAAGRTGITADRRSIGMLVYQVDNAHFYELFPGITDGDWVDLGVWPSTAAPGFQGTNIDYIDPQDQTAYRTAWYWSAVDNTDAVMGILQFGNSGGTMVYMKDGHSTYYLAGTGAREACASTTIIPQAGVSKVFAWGVQGFGLCSDLTDPHFLGSAWQAGFKVGGVVTAGVDDYIMFAKHAASNHIWVDVSTGTGPHNTSVDTGVVLVKGAVNKLGIIIDNFAQLAWFYVDDVLKATIDGGDLTWWPVFAGSQQFFARIIPDGASVNECSTLIDYPWIVVYEK